MRFQFIEKHRSSFPVKKMCHVLDVSPSGYYRWRKGPLSPRRLENERLKIGIKELFEKHNRMVGSPIITADLHDAPEFSRVSRPRVARLMREMGLKCHAVRKFVVTTDLKHNEPVAPNLLDRQFTVSAPNQVWVTHKTILRRRPGRGLMVHSDRGVQYASADFRTVLKKHGFVQSMSRKGNCWDNAVAESFFHSIKTQPIHHCKFQNVAGAEQALFNYIEVYYNRQRKHSTNGYKSPAHFELGWWNNRKVA